jgi:outer membrane protein OmpA-like peptidoglycan-associated protein
MHVRNLALLAILLLAAEQSYSQPVSIRDTLVGGSIFFADGSAAMNPEFRPLLEGVAGAIRSLGNKSIVLIGYSAPSESHDLSFRRVVAVRRYFVEVLEFPPGRVALVWMGARCSGGRLPDEQMRRVDVQQVLREAPAGVVQCTQA